MQGFILAFESLVYENCQGVGFIAKKKNTIAFKLVIASSQTPYH